MLGLPHHSDHGFLFRMEGIPSPQPAHGRQRSFSSLLGTLRDSYLTTVKKNSEVAQEIAITSNLQDYRFTPVLNLFSQGPSCSIKIQLSGSNYKELPVYLGIKKHHEETIDLNQIILCSKAIETTGCVTLFEWVGKSLIHENIFQGYLPDFNDIPFHIVPLLLPLNDEGHQKFNIVIEPNRKETFLILQWTSDGSKCSAKREEFPAFQPMAVPIGLPEEYNWQFKTSSEVKSLNFLILKLCKQNDSIRLRGPIMASQSATEFTVGHANPFRKSLLVSSLEALNHAEETSSSNQYRVDVRQSAFIKLIYVPVNAAGQAIADSNSLKMYCEEIERQVENRVEEGRKEVFLTVPRNDQEIKKCLFNRLGIHCSEEAVKLHKYQGMPFLDFTHQFGIEEPYFYLGHKLLLKLNGCNKEIPAHFVNNDLLKKIFLHYPHFILFDVKEKELNPHCYRFYEYHSDQRKYQLSICEKTGPVLSPVRWMTIQEAREDLQAMVQLL